MYRVKNQIAKDEEKKKVEQGQKRKAYRIKQLEILFEYIKELWDILHQAGNEVISIGRTCNGDSSDCSIHDRKRPETPEMESDPITAEVLNNLRTRKLHRSTPFIPADEKLMRHLPELLRVASLAPSSRLKSGWFLQSPDPSLDKPGRRRRRYWHRYSNQYLNMYDPTSRKSRFERKFVVDYRRNQTPSWFVETAWQVLVNCISTRVPSYNPETSTMGLRQYSPGVPEEEMDEQFVQWFRETWAAKLEQNGHATVPGNCEAEGSAEGGSGAGGDQASQEGGDSESKLWRTIFRAWYTYKEPGSGDASEPLGKVPEQYKSTIRMLNTASAEEMGKEEVWAAIGMRIFGMGKRLP